MEIYDGSLWTQFIGNVQNIITSTTTVSNTVTETTLYTGAIASNTLQAGNLVRVRASGEVSNATAADDLTLNVYVGSTLVHSFNPAIGNVVDADWHIELDMVVRSIGASGSIAERSHIVIGDYQNWENDDSTTIDTTAEEDITVKVQWDNAKSGNSIKIFQGYIEFHN